AWQCDDAGVTALPVELDARLHDVRVVGHARAFAGHAHVVQHQLGVVAPVPVRAERPGIHAPAADAAIVEIEVVEAQPQLPEAAVAVAGRGRPRQAAAIAPGRAARVPHRAGISAAAVVAAGGQAIDARLVPLALELERPPDPHRLQARSRDA